MVSKTGITFALYSLGFVVALINARSTKYKELKPVLIKSVVSHPRVPEFNHFDSDSQPQNSQEEQRSDERTSRKIYQFPGPGQHHNVRRPSGPPPPPQSDPERGQILHRPTKSGRRNTQQSSSSSQSQSYQNQNEMPNDAPMIIGSGGKGKKVKYVPTMGGSGYPGPEKPPQIYVISNGEDDEDNNGGGNGVVGSMQTYFKSLTGRMRAAFQGLIGGITD